MESNPHFDFAWGACFYNGSLRELIHKFKYGQKTYLRYQFTQLIISFIKTYSFDINQFERIVPIPLFKTRLKERGYNQSQLLAQAIAQEFNIGLSVNNLVRIRNTKHQAHLNQKERWTNIHGAFRIQTSAEFSGKSILIVDDLLTTGATSSEAAKTLKDSGATTIGVLTLAIAV